MTAELSAIAESKKMAQRILQAQAQAEKKARRARFWENLKRTALRYRRAITIIAATSGLAVAAPFSAYLYATASNVAPPSPTQSLAPTEPGGLELKIDNTINPLFLKKAEAP